MSALQTEDCHEAVRILNLSSVLDMYDPHGYIYVLRLCLFSKSTPSGFMCPCCICHLSVQSSGARRFSPSASRPVASSVARWLKHGRRLLCCCCCRCCLGLRVDLWPQTLWCFSRETLLFLLYHRTNRGDFRLCLMLMDQNCWGFCGLCSFEIYYLNFFFFFFF